MEQKGKSEVYPELIRTSRFLIFTLNVMISSYKLSGYIVSEVTVSIFVTHDPF